MNVIVNLNDCEVIRLLEVLQFILEILNARHGVTVGYNTLDWFKKWTLLDIKKMFGNCKGMGILGMS